MENIFILCKCNDKYVDIDISSYSLIVNVHITIINVEDLPMNHPLSMTPTLLKERYNNILIDLNIIIKN